MAKLLSNPRPRMMKELRGKV